jgi:hypothetical protein
VERGEKDVLHVSLVLFFREIFHNEGIAVMLSRLVECFACPNRDKLYKAFYMFHSPCWKMSKAGIKVSHVENCTDISISVSLIYWPHFSALHSLSQFNIMSLK